MGQMTQPTVMIKALKEARSKD